MGAQCVLLSNLAPEKGLVNGSRGVVTGFARPDLETPSDLSSWFSKNGPMVPVVKFGSCSLHVIPRESSCESGDDCIVTRIQIPLALCFATTIHKSQGLTLDKCAADLGEAFEVGQAYTALSRGLNRQKKRDLFVLFNFISSITRRFGASQPSQALIDSYERCR